MPPNVTRSDEERLSRSKRNPQSPSVSQEARGGDVDPGDDVVTVDTDM
jgi:hypothetical protein